MERERERDIYIYTKSTSMKDESDNMFYLERGPIEYSIYSVPTKQGSHNFIPAQPLYDSCCVVVRFTIPSKYSIYLV